MVNRILGSCLILNVVSMILNVNYVFSADNDILKGYPGSISMPPYCTSISGSDILIYRRLINTDRVLYGPTNRYEIDGCNTIFIEDVPSGDFVEEIEWHLYQCIDDGAGNGIFEHVWNTGEAGWYYVSEEQKPIITALMGQGLPDDTICDCYIKYQKQLEECGGEVFDWSDTTCSGICGKDSIDKPNNFGKQCP